MYSSKPIETDSYNVTVKFKAEDGKKSVRYQTVTEGQYRAFDKQGVLLKTDDDVIRWLSSK